MRHVTRPRIAAAVALALPLVFAGVARSAPDQAPARRLADSVDSRFTFGGSHPADFVRVGDLVFFAAETRYSGRELWVTDRRTDETRMVRELVPGAGASAPRDLLAGDGVVYFRASTPGRPDGAWQSDGTAVGTLAIDALPAAPAPRELVAGSADVRDLEFYAGETAGLGVELFRTDGTQAGTYLVKDISPGEEGSYPDEFTRVGDVVFFEARTEAEGYELWKTDGTAEGTVLVADLRPGPGWGAIDSLANLDDRLLLFSGWDEVHAAELWRSDGTGAGTFMVKDLAPNVNGAGNSDSGRPRWITDVGDGVAYFAAATELALVELWRTDGTEAGTALVADLEPDLSDGHIEHLVPVSGGAFFTAGDDPGSARRGLWASDGTALGTARESAPQFADGFPRGMTRVGAGLLGRFGDSSLFRAESASVPPSVVDLALPVGDRIADFPLVPLDDRALFTVEPAAGGRELWVTDGSALGTARLGFGSTDVDRIPDDWAALGASVYLANSLTRSDGTADGTDSFFAFASEIRSPHSTVVVGQRILFLAETRGTGVLSVHSYEPATDTSRSLHAFDAREIGRARSLWAIGGSALFLRADRDELWQTDGTAAGTSKVADVVAGFATDFEGTRPATPVRVGSRVLFSAITAANGHELYRLDDGSAGATLVADIAAGAESSGPSEIVPLGSSDYAVFVAADAAHGMELWLTDGTDVGTALLCDVLPGTLSSNPRQLVLSGTDLFFVADGDATGAEPWALSLDGLGLPASAFDGGVSLPDGAPLGTAAEELELDRVRVRLDFRRSGRDSVRIRGSLRLPADFEPDGTVVVVDVAGLPLAFELNRKGRSTGRTNRIVLRLQRGGVGQDGLVTVPFTLRMRRDWKAALGTVGLVENADEPRSTATVPIGVLVDGVTRSSEQQLDYSYATRRRRGKASEQR